MFNRVKSVGNLPALLKKAQKSQKNMKKVQNSFKNKLFEKRNDKEVVLHMTGEFQVKNIKVVSEFVKEQGVQALTASLTEKLNKIYNEVDNYRAKELEKVNTDFDQNTLDQIGQALGAKVAQTLKDAQEAQEKAKEYLESFKEEVFEESFAQDNIKLKMKGSAEILSFEINESFVDTEDMEMLEDSLVYALNNMYEKVDIARTEELNKANEGLPTDVVNGMF